MTDVLALSPVGEAGGAENFLLDVLRQLGGRGHRVGLLVAGPGPLLQLARDRGVPARPLPAADLGSPRSALDCVRALRREARRADPSAPVLLSHPKAHLLAVAAGLTRTRPVLLQLYDAAVRDNRIDRLSARLPVRRVAIGRRTAAAYEAAVRPAASQRDQGRVCIPVIRPTVDLGSVRARVARGDARGALRRAALTPGRLDLVMVARLQSFKGVHAFLTLAGDLAQTEPTSRSLLIGPDAPGEPELRQQLQSLLDQRGLTGRVALAGYLSDDDLAAVVAHARLLVHPADHETFGLVLVEAMAVGTPVVAYRSEGPEEVLGRGGGVLVANGDQAALAAAVRQLLDDEPARQALGAQAALHAQRFDVAGLAQAYEALLGLSASA